MEDLSEYLRWEAADNGARITGCDTSFEGAMAIPGYINGIPVVEIGQKAFAECKKITSVALPDTVEVVGEYAFYKCDELEELRLGAGITRIEENAIPYGVTLVVDADSYAEEWCRENDRKYKVR